MSLSTWGPSDDAESAKGWAAPPAHPSFAWGLLDTLSGTQQGGPRYPHLDLVLSQDSEVLGPS